MHFRLRVDRHQGQQFSSSLRKTMRRPVEVCHIGAKIMKKWSMRYTISYHTGESFSRNFLSKQIQGHNDAPVHSEDYYFLRIKVRPKSKNHLESCNEVSTPSSDGCSNISRSRNLPAISLHLFPSGVMPSLGSHLSEMLA